MPDRPPTIVTRSIRIEDVQPGMVVQYARRDGSPSNNWFTVTRISRQMYGDQLGHVYLFAREADIEDLVRQYGPNLSAHAARHESPLSLVSIQEEVPA